LPELKLDRDDHRHELDERNDSGLSAVRRPERHRVPLGASRDVHVLASALVPVQEKARLKS